MVEVWFVNDPIESINVCKETWNVPTLACAKGLEVLSSDKPFNSQWKRSKSRPLSVEPRSPLSWKWVVSVFPMKSFVNTYNFHRIACVVSHYQTYG